MSGTSKSFQLDKNDLYTLLFRTVLVGVAAMMTYLGEKAVDLDLGSASVFIVPIITVALSSLTRWLKDYTKEKEEKKDGM